MFFVNDESSLVNGELGLIEGSSKDLVVLETYKYFGNYSLDIVNIFKKFFFKHNGGFFIDIGSNIGLISIPVMNCKNISGMSFEPDPTNYYYLGRNLDRYNIKMNCFNIALGNNTGKSSLTLSNNNLGDHRISVDGDKLTIDITMDKLDNFLYLIDITPIAVKIDTQGSEIEIIKGGRELLSRCELITMEFWPYGIKRLGSNLKVLLDFLSNNFKYSNYTMEFWNKKPLFDINSMLKIMENFFKNSSTKFYDLIFSKSTL